ncbi:MAG: ATP-dependent RNA helicase HrpA [Pirellulales bacterium]
MIDPNRNLEADIDSALGADRRKLRRRLRGIRQSQRASQPFDRNLARWLEDLQASVERRQQRLAARPAVTFDAELPVCQKRDEIAAAIRDHQVVVVCGETGSGKSTQLPKICLEMGRGIDGLIGHTQPRRIAARSVAARIAEELGGQPGQAVGFKVRFTDATGPRTFIKLMTDGILLAETQGDRELEQYDTIILDEAHERSLNIDFLLGYLKRLLPRRPDLKLIITSATIDAERFAAHFPTPPIDEQPEQPAPIVMVSGRTYPVEVRYRPPVEDEETGEIDMQRSILDAVDEVAAAEAGDMLIFMPTERHIHELAKGLRGRLTSGRLAGRATEILPLYARLSSGEQNRVFQPHTGRRIVIATNVAESSLTVPGIRAVIDPGTARVSRYSPRSNMQRLPIEPVSQASSDQRKGRCGRVGPGLCIRLYSHEDYESREAYTPPEIQRTNLAAVVLQTQALGLGQVEDFPFLDPPRPEAVRDGYRTLFELGAIDDGRRLTDIGRRLSRLPADPRIGRMILAAHDENCLHEVLIIAAALELQDPRERPLDKQQEADAAHARFVDTESDFMGYLKLWDFYHGLAQDLSRSKLQKACRQNFLSHNRLREWLDLHRQLLQIVQDAGMKQQARRNDYGAIHRALLAGLLSHVAHRSESGEYNVAGGGRVWLWPGSGTVSKKPKWLVAAEQIETTRRFARTVGRIDPAWIEAQAGHLVRRTHSDPFWHAESGQVLALEKVSLFGLPVVAARRVRFAPVEPGKCREMFIQHALVLGEWQTRAAFLAHNKGLQDDVARLEAKTRRRDLLRDEEARFDFYEQRVPVDVVDGMSFERWRRLAERDQPKLLYMSASDLLRDTEDMVPAEQYPDRLATRGFELPLEYRYEPGQTDDGVTVTIPREGLAQLDRQLLAWLVPGLLEEKVASLIKSLPKPLRTMFVPAPQTAQRVAAGLRFGHGSLLVAVAESLTRIAGQRITPDAFQEDRLPDHLRMNVRVTDEHGQPVAAGRDIAVLRKELGTEAVEAAPAPAALEDTRWSRDGLTTWDFGDLPEQVEIVRGSLTLPGFPALVDRGESVSLRLLDSAEAANESTRGGLRRLFSLAAARDLKSQVQHLPQLDRMLLHAATVGDAASLRQQLAALLADRALFGTPAAGLPRNAADFELLLKLGRRQLGMAVQDVANLLGPLWQAYHEARLKLEQTTLAALRYATDDIRQQLHELTPSGFLLATPWPWLVHYPRYLKAIRLRLEKASSGRLAQDQKHAESLLPKVAQYRQRAARLREHGYADAELETYRWMLEEFRVSLFAQELGTSQPVSPQRLDKQWAKVSL